MAICVIMPERFKIICLEVNLNDTNIVLIRSVEGFTTMEAKMKMLAWCQFLKCTL